MGRTLSIISREEKNLNYFKGRKKCPCKLQQSPRRNKSRLNNLEIKIQTENVHPKILEKKDKGSKEVEDKSVKTFFGFQADSLESMFQETLQKGDQDFEDAVAFNTLSFALAMVSL